jgi:SAM-dependent methyltransferase
MAPRSAESPRVTGVPSEAGMILAMETRNVCAGPFGAVYDFYIERPRLARLVLGAMWGVDPRPFDRSLATVSRMPDDATILDVPCGGGIALRGLRPGQRARWIAVDIEPAMLTRAHRRAARHPAMDVQVIQASIESLPLPDHSAELCLSYGGLHCLANPRRRSPR